MKREITETDWEEKYLSSGNDKTIEQLWNSLKMMLLGLRGKFVPKQKLSGKPSWKKTGSFPVDNHLQEAIRIKRSSHRRWMSTTSGVDRETARLQYTRARKKVKKLMHQAKRKFESEMTNKSKSNPKAFWSHVRSKLKTRSGVPPLIENDNDTEFIRFSDEEKSRYPTKPVFQCFYDKNHKENVLIYLVEPTPVYVICI